MRRPLTSPASWVLWSRVTPPCRWSRILWPPIFHPLWCLPGSPAPSFLPSRVGPLPLLSGSPTSQPVRQVWPFTQWPSFRPTRRTSWRRWMKGPAWLLKPWRNWEPPDLALRATKHTARAVGRSMAALVAAERHLWLNLTEIREREKVFLLDAPISQCGLFGEAISAVVDKFRSAKTQSAALKQFMPRRSRDYSTPSSSVSREQSLPRKEPSGGGAQATRPSPTTVWGAHGRSFLRQQPRKRVNLKRPNRPAASANPGCSWPSGQNEESRFTVTGRGQTAEAFLPAPNVLSSLKSVTATLRGLVCRSSSPSFLLGLAVGGRVRLSPSTARPFAASGPRVRRHSCFSPAVYGTRAGHPSVQHFSLHHPEQGRRGLSFTVEGAASRHPISGMSSLARHSASSIALLSRMGPGVSLWVLRTIRSGYTLQFGKNPPRFDGVHLTVVNSASKASVLRQELSSLLQKGAIEEVPQSDIERGFFSRYFLVPKRDGGLRPILDLRRFNFSLYKGKFKMLTMKTIMSQVQGGDWFVTIDLKDAYFHIHVYEMHGCCTGPFEAPGHSCTELSGRLAHSGSLQGASESSQGYRSRPHPFAWPQDERQEECAPPISANRVSGVRLDSVQMQARLAPAPIPDLTACLARFKLGHHVSVGTCRRLLGLMAAASPVLPLGLLHMRPFLWWMKELRLHPTVPATRLIRVSRSCCRLLLLWRDPAFLRSGVRMGAIHPAIIYRQDWAFFYISFCGPKMKGIWQ